MKKIISHWDLFSKNSNLEGKTIIDVGCGTGEFVRWLASQGAIVTGIDTKEMLAKMHHAEQINNEKYFVGSAEKLPFKKNYADFIFYIASFHHVPENKMFIALKECKRVLKPSGTVIFVEPVAQNGSYYEIVKLIGDESEIQAKAYKLIQGLSGKGFRMKKEMKYYLERSFKDFKHLVEIFVDEEIKKSEVILAARKITKQRSIKLGKDFKTYRYKSVCRLNILEKMI
jgi:ubiquinone/menaquinone biosynthesis C-methylase UbiE